MEWQGHAENGKLTLNRYQVSSLREFIFKNPKATFNISARLPESRKQRKYLHGCLIPLIAFYQEGMDHHNSTDLGKVFDWLKLEFNAEVISVGGKQQRVAKSSRGSKALNELTEKVTDFLVDNYAPPADVLNPARYKEWHAMLTTTDKAGTDNYIDHLVELGTLSAP